jgi:hypothetical protein
MMKSPAGYYCAVAGAALCVFTPLAAASLSADQARPKVKVVQPAPDAPPAVVVEPPDPAAPRVAIVPPMAPGTPPAVAVIPPDPGLPTAVFVPPPGAKVEIAVAAVGPAPTGYPPCSATITDRCIQTYEGRRRRR